jgi:phage shock protein PspC (stress-responsive transcriptional regulator)
MTNQSTSETRQPASQARFFGWLRSLGVVRDNGWLGGVCGGIAERIGIDPIIVRGIAVVVALLGGPAFLFYAVAWALLPDRENHIHFERMLKGIFDPAAVGIIVFAVLAFAPLVQGVWWAGFPIGGVPVVSGIIRLGWTLLVIGLIITFVVWAARGFPGGPWRNGTWTSGTATDSTYTGSTATASGGTATSAAAQDATTSTVPEPGSARVPTSPTDATAGAPTATPDAGAPSASAAAPTDASTAELDDWKRRQAESRAERDAFARQQQADQRALRDQRATENRTAALARAEQARALRERERMLNPHTSAAYVFATIGLAIVAGAIMAIFSGAHTAWSGYEQTAGLAVATLVFGLSIIVAGFMRRRSGFLTFLSILLVLATIGSAFTQANAHHLLSFS